MNIKDLKRSVWVKIWAGTWSFLSCSHFGKEYTQLLHFGGRPFMSQVIILITKGKSHCWAPQEDRDRIGAFFATEVTNDHNRVDEVCCSLKMETDKTLFFIISAMQKRIDAETHQQFWDHVVRYYPPHIYVKYVVDYLSPQLLEKFLPQFEEARLYCEPVFKKTEEFIITLANQIAVNTGLPAHLVRCLTREEVDEYLRVGTIPSEMVLEKREKGSALLFDSESRRIYTGKDATDLESVITPSSTGSVSGAVAFPGKAQGIARIVLDPAKGSNFSEGDILVTGMTRPEYLSFIKKSAAFVTDSGGVLSHAAIVARELKKPCVIGTKNATKVFKDGDLVEVDANKGIVRKL